MAQESSKGQPISLIDLEEFKPQTEEDSRERAIFYATAMAVLAGNILTSYINYCKSAVVFSPNGQFKPVETPPISEELFKQIAKEVQTVSLWLAVCENSDDDIPEWFKEFSYFSLRASDELIEAPLAKEVFELYPLDLGIIPTIQSLSMNVCHKLALGETRVDAALALGDIILEAARQRIELLKFSLSQSMLVLDTWVAEVKPGAFQLQF